MKTTISCLARKVTPFFFLLTLPLLFIRCSTDSLLLETEAALTAAETHASAEASTIACAECTYVVQPNKNRVDGKALNLKPGDVVCLDASKTYPAIILENIVGTAEKPIIIKNCGGNVLIDATGRSYGITARHSKHFRITGGDTEGVYGIRVHQGHLGVAVGDLSTDVEIDHLAIEKSGFAGIMTKTDPGCDPATWRENFVMKNVLIHHNRITETGGEGIYAGNSFFGGMQTDCGVKLPHEIHHIEIYNNVLENTGWEAIQLGCATQGASIHDNTIRNYGLANRQAQNNGIQIGDGTGGLCYNNLIQGGKGNGIILLGLGDNVLFNNIIDQAGNYGIFCDERSSTIGNGFVFLNNTILRPNNDGLRIYAELVPENVFINNIIAEPGSGKFIVKLNNEVNIRMSNNYFTGDADSLRMADAVGNNYRIANESPVVDKGMDVSRFQNILHDFYRQARLSGKTYDIGAVEAQWSNAGNPGDKDEETPENEEQPGNAAPEAFAGSDQTVMSPVNSAILAGRGTDPDGHIVSYRWTQYGGPQATIASPDAPATVVQMPEPGRYFFRLTVTDNGGATDYDNVLVKVVEGESRNSNQAPVPNAGRDITLYLPARTTTLQGSASDPDGTIASYEWLQYGGPASEILQGDTPTPTVITTEAGRYFYRLVVADNDGATAYDNMLVRVLDSAVQ